MARPKKKTDRDLIKEAQNLDEAGVLARLETLKAQYENIQKQKADARKKSMRLTRDGVFDDLMLELADFKCKFEACETLEDFDVFRDRLKNKIKFLCAFYELNQNKPGIQLPIKAETEEPEKPEEVNKEE